MLNFRIANCIVCDNITKCAILEDESINKRKRRRVIQKDENGKEYFTLPNMKDGRISKSYSNRIGEAVEEVINGNGDVISSTNILGIRNIRVLYFLDREYGNQLKEKSIEGWKDSKFKWVILKPNPFNYESYVSKNSIPVFDKSEAMVFDTEKEALKFIEKMYDKAYEFIDHNNSTENVIKEIQNEYNIKNIMSSVIFDIFVDIIIEDEDGRLKSRLPRNIISTNRILKPAQIIYEK